MFNSEHRVGQIERLSSLFCKTGQLLQWHFSDDESIRNKSLSKYPKMLFTVIISLHYNFKNRYVTIKSLPVSRIAVPSSGISKEDSRCMTNHVSLWMTSPWLQLSSMVTISFHCYKSNHNPRLCLNSMVTTHVYGYKYSCSLQHILIAQTPFLSMVTRMTTSLFDNNSVHVAVWVTRVLSNWLSGLTAQQESKLPSLGISPPSVALSSLIPTTAAISAATTATICCATPITMVKMMVFVTS